MSLLQLLLDGRITEFNSRRGQRVTLDFFAVDLSGHRLLAADLSGANLEKADLSTCDLTGAILARTTLAGADLTGAILDRCVGVKIRMREASFSEGRALNAEMSGGDFSEADLSGSDFTEARFTGARLKEITAVKAIFAKADLSDARLSDSDLREADFTGANLSGVDLTKANLTGAILCKANLKGAKMAGAKLVGADLTGASLMEADLSGADLTGAKLEDVDATRADLFDVLGDPSVINRLAAPAPVAVVPVPETIAIMPEIHVDQPIVAVLGETVAVIWDNTGDEEEPTLYVGVLGHLPTEAMPKGGLPAISQLTVASEQVLARSLLPAVNQFLAVLLLDSPGGVVLQVHSLSLTGVLSPPQTIRLGYTPVVRPVFVPDGDGFLLYGIGRQGALSVHRYEAANLKELLRAPAGTYRGFCGQSDPILLGKGGTLAVVRSDGIGRLMTAPTGYPGRLTAASWREEDDRVAVAWTLREERGLRFQEIGTEGEPLRLDAKLEIGAVHVVQVKKRWLLAWTREAVKGGEATVPVACYMPGGKPFSLLPQGITEEITEIRSVFSERPLLALVTFDETLLIISVNETQVTLVGRLG